MLFGYFLMSRAETRGNGAFTGPPTKCVINDKQPDWEVAVQIDHEFKGNQAHLSKSSLHLRTA